MASGIYKITDLRNNLIYIGRAIDLDNRKWRHYCFIHPEDYSEKSLKAEINMKIHQAMMDSHKAEDFQFDIIELCPEEELNEKEKYYIKKYNCKYPNVYNSTDGGNTYPHQKGEEHYLHKITKEEANQIKQMLKDGKSVEEIQQKITIATMGIISSINNGYSWKEPDIQYPISVLNGVKRFSDEEIIKIREMRANGISTIEIANLFNTGTSTISSITTGVTRKDVGGPISERQARNLLSQEEVEFNRKFYADNNITIKDLWTNFINKTNNGIGYDSFKHMIEGKTYTQYAIFERKDFKQNRNDLIKKLATQGFTKKEIAEKANCSVRTVYRVLK